MKHILSFVLFGLLFLSPAFADDMFDVDYEFIDRAFEGIQPVTDEQFNKTIDKLTPQPVDNTFTGKLVC